MQGALTPEQHNLVLYNEVNTSNVCLFACLSGGCLKKTSELPPNVDGGYVTAKNKTTLTFDVNLEKRDGSRK